MPSGLRIIGLTGGIATGKSTVARFFATRGIPVIDADQLARDAVLPGTPALEQIVSRFGQKILTSDGALDRKRLAALVFPDPVKRRQLEDILHPNIRQLAKAQIAQAAAAGHKHLIYMAPLLIEAGATAIVDEIWVVTVRPEVQLERLIRRDGISPELAASIIAAQMPLAEKEARGTVVIDNSGTEAETQSKLETAWAEATKEQQ